MNIELKLEANLMGKELKGKLIKSFKKVGETVKPGQVLFQIEGGKNALELKSNAEGVIKSINFLDGDEINVNSVVAIIDGKLQEDSVNKSIPNNTFNYYGNILSPVKENYETDVTIIGGGPGGYVAAIHAAKNGLNVTLIEKDQVGGTCLNWGCIPTKALVRSAEVYNLIKNSGDYGISVGDVALDMSKIVARKDKIVVGLTDGIKYLLKKNNVRVINGTATIKETDKLEIKDTTQDITIKTKNIIIATGAKPCSLNIPGIDSDKVIDSSAALNLKELPKSIAIVGGGVIGMEFAHIFRTLNVEVSVIEYFEKCLVACDSDVSEENERIAKSKGIKLYTGSKVEEIVEDEEGNLIVKFTKNGEVKYLSTEKVLLAVGRVPVTEGMGLENIDVAIDSRKKGIIVNEKLQTNVLNVYAIGDVTNIIQLAHVASHQGIVAVDNILGRDSIMNYETVPSAIFTHPEIATVGLCERAAREKGINFQVGKFPYAANGKAQAYGEPEGFIKILKNKDNNEIIGATIIGCHATDLIGELALAVKNKLTSEQIIETIHAHPTTSEIIHEAALALEGGALHYAE